jgi:serine-type D-Ala-D-Ala carboxypeptidase/endopeptidase (penicillin-binding protein 4)
VRWTLAAVLVLTWAAPLSALAQLSSSPLPPALVDAYQRAQVPLDSVAVVVREVGTPKTSASLLSYNAERALNPASVMKLVTTYAGLELLGPAYSWKTEVWMTGDLRNGTLQGDLILKGGGDPKLTVERFWLLLKQLRERGLQTIKGDLVLDKSFFGVVDVDPARFDGEALRAYNVGPDALLLNFKTVRFQFAPSFDGRAVAISPDIKPVQLEVVNRTKLIDGPCGDWRERVKLDVQQSSAIALRVVFTGNYAKTCGERAWNVALLDHPRFVGGAFASMWNEVGGVWSGAVRLASTPADARLLASVESPPLSDAIRDINKFSNNVMARQLLLTIAAESDRQPGTTARGTEVIKSWLARKGIVAPELVIDNGSGLSRVERISAANLADVLDAAFRSSVMPEFLSSFSLVGVDGTFRRRATNEIAAGVAHMKSGTLNDVRAVAGYILANDNKRYLVVMMVNHSNAILAQAAQDVLLGWVYARNPNVAGPVAPLAERR